LDIHRSYATVAAVDGNQQVVLTARRIDYEHFDEWMRKNLRPSDAVTLESTGNAWYFHDLLAPLVASVTGRRSAVRAYRFPALDSATRDRLQFDTPPPGIYRLPMVRS